MTTPILQENQTIEQWLEQNPSDYPPLPNIMPLKKGETSLIPDEEQVGNYQKISEIPYPFLAK